MRLFLLPISTRRTLIYCQKLEQTTGQPSIIDRVTTKANETWASWEKKESGWQKKVTQYGNVLLRRIPFEEWGLKTIPPLSAKRKRAEMSKKDEVEVLFPSLFLANKKVPNVLKELATERQSLHRSKMIWSLIGIPITLPFALVPV
jgi:Mitochondrial K+-H+ exchange-related